MQTNANLNKISAIAMAVIMLSSCIGPSEKKAEITTIDLASEIKAGQDHRLDFGELCNTGIIPIETKDIVLPYRLSLAGADGDTFFLNNNEAVTAIDIRSGAITGRISRKGNGPQEYVMIAGASVDNIRKLIYVYDPAKGRTLCYDYSGNYVDTDATCPAGMTHILPDGNKMVCHSPFSDSASCFGIYGKDDRHIRDGSIRKSGIRTSMLYLEQAFRFDDASYFRRSLCDTIYCITTESDIPAIVVNRGRYVMPDEYYQSLEQVNRNIDRYIDINTYMLAAGHLFLEYRHDRKKYRDVWDTGSSELLSRTIISGPDSDYGFPVTVNGVTLHCWPDFASGNSAFCILPYSEAAKLVPDLTEESNPVILRIDFKEAS